MKLCAAEITAKNHASFAIPRAAVDALIHAQADVVTIGAYLVLASHTEKTGQFSTAGLKAIRENLAINRPRAEKAIRRLSSINVQTADNESNKQLVYERESWLRLNRKEQLPDKPHARAKILHVLPSFDEPLQECVWIGSGLVRGDDLVERPLKQLKDCGDMAARLLLALYAGQDLDRWYGVPPDRFVWNNYSLGETSQGQYRVVHASHRTPILRHFLLNRIAPQSEKNNSAVYRALEALESAGFIYEAVVLLNRNPVPAAFSDGTSYGAISPDAEILCDLGSPSPFGPVLDIERGLGKEYADTVLQLAKQQDYPTTSSPFDTPFGNAHYDYLVPVPTGQPAMIAGLYRLRFRVTHFKNAFVEDATRQHFEANAVALRKLDYFRAMKNLKPITRTLQSSSIPIQSSSMTFNSVQCNEHGEGECRGETPTNTILRNAGQGENLADGL